MRQLTGFKTQGSQKGWPTVFNYDDTFYSFPLEAQNGMLRILKSHVRWGTKNANNTTHLANIWPRTLLDLESIEQVNGACVALSPLSMAGSKWNPFHGPGKGQCNMNTFHLPSSSTLRVVKRCYYSEVQNFFPCVFMLPESLYPLWRLFQCHQGSCCHYW